MTSVVLSDEFEVVPELTRMRLPKEVLLDIFDKALGERAVVNKLDPVETGGTEMRRWITRFLRENPTLKTLGWKLCRHGQIEGIRNDQLQIKLAYTNTNACTGVLSKQPSNIAKKGDRTADLAKRNRIARQLSLGFADGGLDPDPISKYDFWYFCGFASDEHVSAEISRPDVVKSGFIKNFSNRIILVQPGELKGLKKPKIVPEDFAVIQPIKISRKQ